MFHERLCEHMQLSHFIAAQAQQYCLSGWHAISSSTQESGSYFPELFSTRDVLGECLSPEIVTVAPRMDRQIFFTQCPSRTYCLNLCLPLKLCNIFYGDCYTCQLSKKLPTLLSYSRERQRQCHLFSKHMCILSGNELLGFCAN